MRTGKQRWGGSSRSSSSSGGGGGSYGNSTGGLRAASASRLHSGRTLQFGSGFQSAGSPKLRSLASNRCTRTLIILAVAAGLAYFAFSFSSPSAPSSSSSPAQVEQAASLEEAGQAAADVAGNAADVAAEQSSAGAAGEGDGGGSATGAASDSAASSDDSAAAAAAAAGDSNAGESAAEGTKPADETDAAINTADQQQQQQADERQEKEQQQQQEEKHDDPGFEAELVVRPEDHVDGDVRVLTPEELANFEATWLWRYETPGLEWKQEGVEYRGAPWIKDVGQWLAANEHESTPVSIVEKAFVTKCPENCRGKGNCDQQTGRCHCYFGFTGESCSDDAHWPCNLPPGDDFPFGHPIATICAAQCDTRTGRCYCGGSSKYPYRPAVAPCGFAVENDDVNYKKVHLEALFSYDEQKPGWCNAVPGKEGQEPAAVCFNNYDGYTGDLLEMPVESFCLNQCSGHGTCIGGGCRCHHEWYGIDCSIPSLLAITGSMTDGRFDKSILPPWLHVAADHAKPKVQQEGGGGGGRRLLLGVEEAAAVGKRRALQEDRKFGVDHLETKRAKPLFYVYELPTKFTSDLIEGRHWKYICAHRLYDDSNNTLHNSMWLYGHETAIYEAFLNSPQRTNNIEEAHYFVVPLLTACLHAQADESPRMEIHADNPEERVRPRLVMEYALEVYTWLKENYAQQWEKHEGLDHIWFFSWDEGACYAPEVIRNSIFLTPWGNGESVHKGTASSYGFDGWEALPRDKRGESKCFDFNKDIVVPSLKNPSKINPELIHRPLEERKFLFFFRGDLGVDFGGRSEETYSLGIRQKVGKLFASVANRDGRKGEPAADDVAVEHAEEEPKVEFEDMLSSSRFCGVFPGDGFSARLEDAILHGCIPVIIQDGIHLPFETHLEYASFTIRIKEDDIPQMIEILRSIPEDRVRQMMETVQKIWMRFTYSSVALSEAQRLQLKEGGEKSMWSQAVRRMDHQDDDAVATIFQILRFKHHNDV